MFCIPVSQQILAKKKNFQMKNWKNIFAYFVFNGFDTATYLQSVTILDYNTLLSL